MLSSNKTILLMVSKVFSSISVLGLSILFSRLLSKEDYGTYIQVNMLVQLFGVVLAFGLPSSFYYFLPKKINRHNLLKRTVFLQVLVGFVAALVLIAGQDLLGSFFNNQGLVIYVKFSAICIFCSLFIDFIMPVLLYRQASIVLAKINIFRSSIMFVSTLFCLIEAPGIDSIIFVFTGNYVLGLTISVFVLVGDIKLYSTDVGLDNVKLMQQLKYSLPLSLSVVFWLLGRELDKYIVSHYLSQAALAVYARGAMELPLVHIVANTVAQVNLTRWVELWDRGKRVELLSKWHVSIARAAVIMFPIFILFEIIGYDFIVFLYSENYAQSATIFLIYLFLVPLQITSYTSYVQATGNNRYIVYGYVGQILFNICVSIYVIKKIGPVGPAIVTVLGMYGWTLYMVVVISRIFNLKFVDIFPWWTLLKIMSISLLTGLASLLLLAGVEKMILMQYITVHLELIRLVKMMIVGLQYCIMYYYLSCKFKILDEEDMEIVGRWLQVLKFWAK